MQKLLDRQHLAGLDAGGAAVDAQTLEGALVCRDGLVERELPRVDRLEHQQRHRQLGDARGVVLLVGVLFVEDLARFLLNEQGGAGVDVDLLKGGGRYAQQGDEQAKDQKKSKKAAFFHGNIPRCMIQSNMEYSEEERAVRHASTSV